MENSVNRHCSNPVPVECRNRDQRRKTVGRTCPGWERVPRMPRMPSVASVPRVPRAPRMRRIADAQSPSASGGAQKMTGTLHIADDSMALVDAIRPPPFPSPSHVPSASLVDRSLAHSLATGFAMSMEVGMEGEGEERRTWPVRRRLCFIRVWFISSN